MEICKRKQGENEALRILKSKGITFNELYFDDGQAGRSLPDLQYTDGRYLEITHTLHNNELTKPKLRQFNKMPIQQQFEIAQKASDAYKRMRNKDYPTNPGMVGALTKEGSEQFARDRKLVDKHFGGYDKRTGRRSEFNCDIPIIEYSSDNILREIIEKGGKHPAEDTDLFIFATEDEFKSMMHLIETQRYNASYSSFMQTINSSPFKIVYVCVWLFEKQMYVIDNPTLMKFWKTDSTLCYQII